MVSLDSAEKNRAFAEAEGANLTLLSDPEGKTAEVYGVLAPGGAYAQRWTFYIGSDGLIRQIDKQVSPASHGKDILGVLEKLGFRRK